MLHTPFNEFGQVILSHDARPSGTQGASITPGNNTFGSYASVIAGASVTSDVYGIEILVHNISVSAAATDSLTTLGIDASGGSSFTDWIPNLLTSYAGGLGNTAQFGVSYYFPLYLKAGTSIGAKGSINNVTVGTQRVQVKLYCRPSRPDLLSVGTFCRSFGENTAASCGTAVTAGTASEGVYTQLGSAIADAKLFFWQINGAPQNSSTFTAGQIAMDLGIGDGTNFKSPIVDALNSMSTVEDCEAMLRGGYGLGVLNDKVYGRCWSAIATTAYTMIAHGVG